MFEDLLDSYVIVSVGGEVIKGTICEIVDYFIKIKESGDCEYSIVNINDITFIRKYHREIFAPKEYDTNKEDFCPNNYYPKNSEPQNCKDIDKEDFYSDKRKFYPLVEKFYPSGGDQSNYKQEDIDPVRFVAKVSKPSEFSMPLPSVGTETSYKAPTFIRSTKK